MINFKASIVSLLASLFGCVTGRKTKKEYYESGGLLTKENYKNGKEEGLTKTFYKSGEINDIDTYKAGQKTNRKSYNEKGKLEFDQDYPYMEEN